MDCIIELSRDSCGLLEYGVVTLDTVGIVCLPVGSLQVFVCALGLSIETSMSDLYSPET